MASRIVYTHVEKLLFSQILLNYSMIIENKKSTLKMKNLAWHRITAEFNSSPVVNIPRTSKQLKTLWLNLKHHYKSGKARCQHIPTRSNMNEITNDNVQAITDAVILVDSSMDSDNFVETVLGNINSELASNEESQNITHPDTPLINAVKIEPMSPINSYPVDIEYTNAVQSPPHSLNNTAYSNHQQQNSTDHISELQQPSEHHQLEMLFMKEKIRCLQQEHNSKEERATAIHNLEYQLLKEKLREARAKADLAELLLRRQK